MNKHKRLISLDAFRGFTIAAMILVNYQGNWNYIFQPLRHAKWNGLTPTDLIFPFFIFIVGLSITLAYTKRIEAGASKNSLYRKIVSRSLKIYIVGVLLGLYPDFNFDRIHCTGVLQRISIVFLVSSLLFLNLRWRAQLVIAAILLIGYWLAMVLIKTPGFDRAMLEPGINLAAWVDSKILPGFEWQKRWTAEGIFSTLPAIATGITGMLAGLLILGKLPREHKVIYLFSFGFFALCIGYLWHYNFPINKGLWNSSYVMVTSGLAAMLLSVSMFFVDIKGRTRFTKPGIIFGSNAITIYVLADAIAPLFYDLKFFGYNLNTYFMNIFEGATWSMKIGSLLFALLYVGLCFIPGWILYHKKIFIKL